MPRALPLACLRSSSGCYSLIEFLAEYGMFLAKIVTFVVAIIVVIGFVVSKKNQEALYCEYHIAKQYIEPKDIAFASNYIDVKTIFSAPIFNPVLAYFLSMVFA